MDRSIMNKDIEKMREIMLELDSIINGDEFTMICVSTEKEDGKKFFKIDLNGEIYAGELQNKEIEIYFEGDI